MSVLTGTSASRAEAPGHPPGMTGQPNPNRVPKGVTTGGQFAASEHAEPDAVALDATDTGQPGQTGVPWEETEAFKAQFVKPVLCRRCRGKGLVETRVVHAGAPGGCFSCSGWGYVEGDKATIAARKARAQAATDIITNAVDEAVRRGMPRHNALNISYAISHLAETEPERYEKALDSHLAGHPGLFKALVAYTAERGYFRYGSRQQTADEVLAQMGLD